MRWYHWVVIGLGLWLLISPWLLGFQEINLALFNNFFVGIVLILMVFWDAVYKNKK